ncbi:MAG: amidase [Chloroflexi bacterium]|nr:amidase [Chloroflexota bacterium]
MSEPFQLTVAEAAKQIRQGDLSPVTLVQSLLDRIDALEPSLKAWVTIDREEVLSAARQREKDLEQGRPKGPIHGVPVGLKDIYYTAGMKTTACSKIYADFVPGYDATTVARIKDAGGIILGKAVTTEFATGDPSPTINPWNPAHTPGGSSSGSSVAVASRMCAAALGSQTGGSTCRPAAYNGIVGLKPTYGRISRYGVVPVSWSLDTVGILVRSVEDAAIMLQVMAGHDPNDPGSSKEEVPDYLEQIRAENKPPRIGLIKEFFFDHATDEVRRHTDAMAQRLAQAGATVEEVPLPDSFSTAHSCQRVVSNVECAAFHEENYRVRADEYGPKIRSGIEMGMLIPGIRYLQAQRLRRQLREDMCAMFRDVDVLMTPATLAPAPRDLSTTGDASFQVPWTSAGLPTIVVPSGLSEEGLPLAIQLAGLPLEEGKLMGAATWCESTLGVNLSPPDYP